MTHKINITELQMLASDDELVFTVDIFRPLSNILNDMKVV